MQQCFYYISEKRLERDGSLFWIIDNGTEGTRDLPRQQYLLFAVSLQVCDLQTHEF